MTQAANHNADSSKDLDVPFAIVIGASAGGVEALVRLVKKLPANLSAAVFIVVHFPPYGKSVLPQILNRSGSLLAKHAEDGDGILPGHIYIAPPGYHLLLRQNSMFLSHGPRENGHRPAIDLLFRSAARAYQSRAIGVVLSGALDDGTVGLELIKSKGGIAIAQDPNEAVFDSMPRSAIANVEIDYVLPATDIASILTKLVSSPLTEKPMPPDETQIEQEAEVVAADKAASEQGENSNRASAVTCPECGGVLWEIRNDNLVRFRCHVGHAYSLDSLISEQADMVEQALWAAVRALEEKAALARRMSSHARQQNYAHTENQFQERAHEAEKSANLLRQILFQSSRNSEANQAS
ncbi:chemotaxis protein CheB [Trichocoleus desertorum AS-A10]|uniref:chemotaxis protein CheB n=1 Tax=Trichocoleus desertorum TaxID=1481672 RepID=UPI0032992817